MPLLFLQGSELWSQLLKTFYNGFVTIPSKGRILEDHRIYFGDESRAEPGFKPLLRVMMVESMT